MQVLKSQIDDSVNFVIPADDGGFFEARYVRREPHYFICYLSSHSGCNKGCSFCHLTTTGQTMMKDAKIIDFLDQAREVFKHYQTQPKASIVNFNFMARGEPLDNKFLHYNALDDLSGLAYPMDCRFNISTIMPKTFKGSLVKKFAPITPTFYYSFYSTYDGFRNKWLPGAMPYGEALDKLKEYQHVTDKVVKIHGTFIKGENDSPWIIEQMARAIKERDLTIEWNIVRYNPWSPLQGEEAFIDPIFTQLDEHFPGKVKLVSRVGQDVFASCGTFVGVNKDAQA